MSVPLAERIRPKKIEDFVGQEHLMASDGVITKMIEKGNLHSMILWGPPGTGKTTIADLIAKHTNRNFFKLNAISSGIKDVRNIIEKAEKSKFFDSPSPVLFIDEIHRFNKTQQDALLSAVEKGTFVLIGATTENPSFEVIPALLSRCRVYVLEPLTSEHIIKIIDRALAKDYELKQKDIQIKDYDALLYFSGGDARKALNILETVISLQDVDNMLITNELVERAVQKKTLKYDKKGDSHYDIISAFIKSVRGSDPNAAVYWLARMLEGGEDIKFIARRLIILAAEDIGLANPNALLMAKTCFEAVNIVGMPEARIILSETTIYLATSPKSNSAYMAINKAQNLVKQTGDLQVPLHIRNAPSELMNELGYSAGYKYPHDFENAFVYQQYLPDQIKDEKLYYPAKNQREQKILEQLKHLWTEKYSKS